MYELVNFEQKENESIEAYYNRFNKLIYTYTKYNVVLTTLDLKITFILGLKKEQQNICLIIKTQENIDV